MSRPHELLRCAAGVWAGLAASCAQPQEQATEKPAPIAEAPPPEAQVLRLLRVGPIEGRPDAVEQLWVSVEQGADGGSLVLQTEGDELRIAGGSLTVPDEIGTGLRTRWPGLGASLAVCLPEPLALPPAGDGGGARLMEQTGGPGVARPTRRWWVIVLTGDNPCHLTGELRLAADGLKVDAKGLSVSGLPWQSGGRQLARDNARAQLRLYAEENWSTLNAVEQDALLRALREDPKASTLVERLSGGH